MRLSKLLFGTLRATSEELSAPRARLTRAGYLRGEATWLPLGQRVRRKLAGEAERRLAALGSQEFSSPLPAGGERLRALASELSGLLASHRQLPRTVHNLSAAGSSGALELSAFTFHQDTEGAADQTGALLGEFEDALLAASLQVMRARAGVSAEALVLPGVGEGAELLSCEGCGDRSLKGAAPFARREAQSEPPAPMEEVETPGATTIEALTSFLGVPAERTAKALFLKPEWGDRGRLVFAVVRGDTELSELKLADVVGVGGFVPATEEEIRRVGAEPGYGSPVGIRREGLAGGVTVIVDEAVAASANLVAGANRAGWHLLNTNLGRDYRADVVADIALARAGDACTYCGGALVASRAALLASAATHGDAAATELGLHFLDGENRERPVQLGEAHLNIDAALFALAAVHGDEAGLAWPPPVAPYQVLLVALGDKGSGSFEAAAALEGELKSAGVEVLFDDRPLRAGVKFNDADLLGIPLRVTLGERGLKEGALEGKWRGGPFAAVSGEGVGVFPIPLKGAADAILRVLEER